ncbi:hypothetical protein JRO89_XS07G0237800 [Xanthoceras sorbifolium]|uniref:Uncharacterized protein n=1 Tax=Xanthoceras sorbifolium TaxID=99658 RepID=A0ABQ8HUR3_9ROSI|nr:hypothetical protein JRO89_XS07G0237800 [Xanthoceras sorbifolium]
MCHYQPWEENSPEHELFTMDGNSLDELQALAEARLATLEARVVMIERKLELMEERLLFVRKGLYFVCACLFALMAAFAEVRFENRPGNIPPPWAAAATSSDGTLPDLTASGGDHLHICRKMCDYKPWEENSLEHYLFTMDKDILDEMEALLEASLAMLEALIATIRRELEVLEDSQ